MAKRERTKHKGIYKIGEHYYVCFRNGETKTSSNGVSYLVKQWKCAGSRLSDSLKMKVENEAKVKRGKYATARKQETTTFDQLVDQYLKEGDGKNYIVQFIPAYLKFFGGRKLSQLNRHDLIAFRDVVKATPRQRGGNPVTDTTVNRALAGFYPEQSGFRNFFSEKQMQMIIDEAPP